MALLGETLSPIQGMGAGLMITALVAFQMLRVR
jgi:hypothetical protein